MSWNHNPLLLTRDHSTKVTASGWARSEDNFLCDLCRLVYLIKYVSSHLCQGNSDVQLSLWFCCNNYKCNMHKILYNFKFVHDINIGYIYPLTCTLFVCMSYVLLHVHIIVYVFIPCHNRQADHAFPQQSWECYEKSFLLEIKARGLVPWF